MGQQRDGERVVRAKRRPFGVVGVGDGLGTVKPEDLADATVRVDDVGGVVLLLARDEAVRGLRRVAGEVPDGVVARARPDGGRGGLSRRRAGGVPVHLDCRGVGERRHRNPDERGAGRVPGVDIAGNRVVVFVREPNAAAGRAVVVVEAGEPCLGDAHQHREVFERRRWGVRERELAGKFRASGEYNEQSGSDRYHYGK